jgi:hypothetical protein
MSERRAFIIFIYTGFILLNKEDGIMATATDLREKVSRQQILDDIDEKSRAVSAKIREETDREIAAIRAETERIRAATEREIMELRAESERHRAESERYRAESDRYQRITDRRLAQMGTNIGGLNGSIGEIVEMIIIPGVMERMNSFKHGFTVVSPRRQYKKPNGEILTEIDLMLENDTEVMLVEVKTQFAIKWVQRHLKRLELMRKNEDKTHVKGITMFAAVAGVHFDQDALDLAVENGMYIIEIDEDNERIKINPPKIPGTW